MPWQKLTRGEVRKRWPGEMAKEIIKAMKLGWTIEIQGGYARLTCWCENTRSFTIPASPGHGASSAAIRIRDQVSKCPKQHRKLGTNRPRRRH